MDDPLLISRWQFAFTIVYHYLFPALTMGLAGLVFVLKSIYMRNRDEIYNKSARFWGKIFAINFILATNAWAQNPVGYQTFFDGSIDIQSYWAVLLVQVTRRSS